MHPANNPWSSSQPNWYQNPFYTFADVFGAARYHYTSPTSHGNEELMSQQGTNPWPPSTAPWDVNNYDSQPLENLWNQRLPPSPPIPSSPITFDYDSNYYDETIEHHSVAVNMPVVEEINEIQRNQGKHISIVIISKRSLYPSLRGRGAFQTMYKKSSHSTDIVKIIYTNVFILTASSFHSKVHMSAVPASQLGL